MTIHVDGCDTYTVAITVTIPAETKCCDLHVGGSSHGEGLPINGHSLLTGSVMLPCSVTKEPNVRRMSLSRHSGGCAGRGRARSGICCFAPTVDQGSHIIFERRHRFERDNALQIILSDLIMG
eukprot:m.1572022 g.1572022  ORF g.1572022 m.1572022 type:complete len:123 (-) comp25302_c0_seq8:8181-8549(-)